MFNHVTSLEKLLFTKHLAIMLGSGITLEEALQDLANQKKQTTLTTTVHAILADIENGTSLAGALKKYPKIFDALYISLIQLGETAGTLQEDLQFLAKQIEKDRALTSKIQSASLYPLIILSLAVIIGSGVTFFVLPQLVNIFQSLDVTLPLSTRILLFIGDTARNKGIYILLGVVGLAIITKALFRISIFRETWDRLSLNLPILGSFLRNAELSALFRNTGLTLHRGLPLLETLKIQETITNNSVFKYYLIRLRSAVERGEPLSQELEKGRLRHFPSIVAKMVRVGEKTGTLDETLLYLGNYFDDELNTLAKDFPVKLEPIMLIGIGLVVAFVALAIISPIYGITAGIKH